MEAFGWLLFVGGAFLTLGSAFVGLEAGGIQVINLAGTITGAGLMISGAVFAAGGRMVASIHNSQDTQKVHDTLEADSRAEAEAEPRDGVVDKTIMIVSFGLVVIIMVGMVVLAISNS